MRFIRTQGRPVFIEHDLHELQGSGITSVFVLLNSSCTALTVACFYPQRIASISNSTVGGFGALILILIRFIRNAKPNDKSKRKNAVHKNLRNFRGS